MEVQLTASSASRWASYVLAVVLSAQDRPENMEALARFRLAAPCGMRCLEAAPFGHEATRHELRFSFVVTGVSSDGLWVHGRDEVDAFAPKPPCIYAKNLRTNEERSFCGFVSRLGQFTMSDDAGQVAVLGGRLGDADGKEGVSLFLIDLARQTHPPILVLQGLETAHISGLTFTRDGRLLSFARGDEMFLFDCKRSLMTSIGRGIQPKLSPSGKHVSFVDQSNHLIVKNMQTSANLTVGETDSDGATWSADGTRLMYCRPIVGVRDKNSEVVIYDLASQRSEVQGRVWTLGGSWWWIVR